VAGNYLDDRWIAERVADGIKAYQEGKTEEALKAFGDARSRNWEAADLRLNEADALAQKNEREKARALLNKVAEANDPRLQALALYNLGNLDYAENHPDKALQNYRRALRLDPTDRDAKHNLELAAMKMKEQQNQKKDQNQKQDDKKNDQKDKQQDKNQQGDSQDQKKNDPNKNPDASPSPGPSPSPSPNPEGSPSPSPNPGASPSPSPSPSPQASPSPSPQGSPSPQPSPEAGSAADQKEQAAKQDKDRKMEARDARRLLSGLEDEEKKNLREMLLERAKKEGERPVDKDW
jgi:tetratricopeptide (TPR) repeat protein